MKKIKYKKVREFKLEKSSIITMIVFVAIALSFRIVNLIFSDDLISINIIEIYILMGILFLIWFDSEVYWRKM